MRRFKTAWILLALFLVAMGVSTAYTMGDETVVVGEITAADHEVEEGYFALGQKATLIAQPGTKLHGWLATSNRGPPRLPNDRRSQYVGLVTRDLHEVAEFLIRPPD